MFKKLFILPTLCACAFVAYAQAEEVKSSEKVQGAQKQPVLEEHAKDKDKCPCPKQKFTTAVEKKKTKKEEELPKAEQEAAGSTLAACPSCPAASSPTAPTAAKPSNKTVEEKKLEEASKTAAPANQEKMA